MTDTPTYRFQCRIVDQSGETVISDWCSLTTIDEDGSCDNVDMLVASVLRKHKRSQEACRFLLEPMTE